MTQHQKILSILIQRGPEGVLNYEFPQMFILNYKARLDELREKGHPIETIHVKDNVWKYVYKPQGSIRVSRPAPKREPRPVLQAEGQGGLF